MSDNIFSWPVNYIDVLQFRQTQILKIRKNPQIRAGAWHHYAENPIDFINHWCSTYDPRNAAIGLPSTLPFVLFPRQKDLIFFLRDMMEGRENGLIEKARDMGATWICCAFSVWLWIFKPGTAVGWGSRKEGLVDKIGDPDSLFEKMRMIIKHLPEEFLPVGFSERDHMTYMKIINPENNSTITGEAGDNIGRGGRKSIYFKDESAHYERPEKIEAALGDNTNTQIDISSVNGLGNVFHRKRESGVEWDLLTGCHKGFTNVFIMDWSDHPNKDQAWYDDRKRKAIASGLEHIFAQEVERSYASSVENILIKPEWFKAATDAHIKLGMSGSGKWIAGLDVADGGLDKNAFAGRQGPILRQIEEWSAKDTGVTARKCVLYCKGKGDISVQYDCVSVGSGVKSEINRLKEEKTLPQGISFTPWNGGAKVLNPKHRVISGDKESPTNDDFFLNLKAQAWWSLSRRFEMTYRAVMEGHVYNHDDLISIPSGISNYRTLEKECCQPTHGQSTSMKMKVNKSPEGTKSPNIADAVMMAYYPLKDGNVKPATAGSRKF